VGAGLGLRSTSVWGGGDYTWEARGVLGARHTQAFPPLLCLGRGYWGLTYPGFSPCHSPPCFCAGRGSLGRALFMSAPRDVYQVLHTPGLAIDDRGVPYSY
jgi:hypothetical protein